MNCPSCEIPLTRTKYENVAVFQCPTCMGYLVDRNRLLLIKRSQVQSSEALQAEMATHSRPDAQLQIPCPKCRSRRMRKERVQITKEKSFSLDLCRDCNVVWFDGGELARMQIQYEKSAQALEAYAFQQREETRTEEEQQELDQAFAELPKSQSVLSLGGKEGGFAATSIAMAMVTGLSFLLEFPRFFPVMTSAACALCLGAFCILKLEGVVLRFSAVTITTLAEISFLYYVFTYN